MATDLLGLNNLPKNPGTKKNKIRRGRGNASGGNYSGRGMKGQRARSGGRVGLKARSFRNYLLRIPKHRGFKSGRPANIPVNLADLEKYYQENEVVSLRSLVKKGLVPASSQNIKILGNGKINKPLQIKLNNLSASAKDAIIKAGGKILEQVQSADAKTKSIGKKKVEDKSNKNAKDKS
ncbi:MAG: 50S ribosomal protein L15 [Candidatus Komeilibacteria bacterium]